METTTASPTLTDAYLDHLLTTGHRPVSVYAFAKAQGMDEQTFYQQYNNFDALEQRIWTDLFDETLNRLEAEPAFAGYSVREKLLAFFFTHLEVLHPRRSYVLYSAGQAEEGKPSFKTLVVFQEIKKRFKAFASELIGQGLDTGEIVARPGLTDRYAEGLWMQYVFVVRFWAKDTSPGFEQTDAAIEKAVRLGFELMGQNVFDAATDFAKFLWQRR